MPLMSSNLSEAHPRLEGSVILDLADARIVDVNAIVAEWLAREREILLGQVMTEFWSDHDSRVALWNAALLADREISTEVGLLTANGSVLRVGMRCERQRREGRDVVNCMLTPILSGASAEPPSDVQGATYRSMYVEATEGMYRSLPAGGFIDVNPAMARLFAADSPEQMLKVFSRDASVVYADPEEGRLLRDSLSTTGSLTGARIRIRALDGNVRMVSENARAVKDAGGALLFFEGSMTDISEHAATETALRESEALYRSLVDYCRDGVFLIQDGRLLFVNPALGEMLGYAPEELVGRAYMDLVAETDKASQTERRQSREDGSTEVQRYQIALRHVSGRTVVCQVVADAVFHQGAIASAGVIRDITDEHQQQLALRLAERRYRELFEQSPVGLYRSDESGVIVQFNARMAQILGYPDKATARAEIHNIIDLYARPEERLGIVNAVRQRGAVIDEVLSLRRRDGGLIWANLNIQRIEDADAGVQMAGSVQDITPQIEAEQKLIELATRDPLTGLPNRRQFEQQLATRLAQATANGATDYAILFLDLDGFKWINDGLGHGAGDRLLAAIAARLSQCLAGRASLARYGGDEFTVLPLQATHRAHVEALADDISAAFEQPFDIDDQVVYSGASIGIVLGHPDYRFPEQMLRDADTAMYRAKLAGKGKHVVFDEAMHAEARQRFDLQSAMRAALERNEFCIHYQPVVDLRDGRWLGCEALLRWQHPQRGLLLPGEFLQIAEDTGFITVLDTWVLSQALVEVAGWAHRSGAPPPMLNVNVDDRQLASGRLPGQVKQALAASGLPAGCLRLEVTETIFRDGTEATNQRLHALKLVGIGLVVDDFGTGYSSLDSFASSPFDAMKVDRSLVKDIDCNPRHRAIVNTIARFAEELGMELTVEGVERESQRAHLLAAGCVLAQGFLYAKALPAEAFFLRWQAQIAARPQAG